MKSREKIERKILLSLGMFTSLMLSSQPALAAKSPAELVAQLEAGVPVPAFLFNQIRQLKEWADTNCTDTLTSPAGSQCQTEKDNILSWVGHYVMTLRKFRESPLPASIDKKLESLSTYLLSFPKTGPSPQFKDMINELAVKVAKIPVTMPQAKLELLHSEVFQYSSKIKKGETTPDGFVIMRNLVSLSDWISDNCPLPGKAACIQEASPYIIDMMNEMGIQLHDLPLAPELKPDAEFVAKQLIAVKEHTQVNKALEEARNNTLRIAVRYGHDSYSKQGANGYTDAEKFAEKLTSLFYPRVVKKSEVKAQKALILKGIIADVEPLVPASSIPSSVSAPTSQTSQTLFSTALASLFATKLKNSDSTSPSNPPSSTSGSGSTGTPLTPTGTSGKGRALSKTEANELFTNFGMEVEPSPANASKVAIGGMVLPACKNEFKFIAAKSSEHSKGDCAKAVGFEIIDLGHGAECVRNEINNNKNSCTGGNGTNKVSCVRISDLLGQTTSIDLTDSMGDVSVKLFFEDDTQDLSGRYQCADILSDPVKHITKATLAKEASARAEEQRAKTIERYKDDLTTCRTADNIGLAEEALRMLKFMSAITDDEAAAKQKELAEARFDHLTDGIETTATDDLESIHQKLLERAKTNPNEKPQIIKKLRMLAEQYVKSPEATLEHVASAVEVIKDAQKLGGDKKMKEALVRDLRNLQFEKVRILANSGTVSSKFSFSREYYKLMVDIKKSVIQDCMSNRRFGTDGPDTEACAHSQELEAKAVLLPQELQQAESQRVQMAYQIQSQVSGLGMGMGFNSFGMNPGFSASFGMGAGMYNPWMMGGMSGMNPYMMNPFMMNSGMMNPYMMSSGMMPGMMPGMPGMGMNFGMPMMGPPMIR